MRSKAVSQSKLKHCIMSNPARALHKAREFYVKSLEECAGKVGGHAEVLGCPAAAPQVSRLPKSFYVNYSKPNNEEKFLKVLETMSKKISIESNLQDKEEEEEEEEELWHMKRSYSTIVVGLARIDEDEPCYFEEENHAVLYARSRSYAYKRY